MSTATAAGRWPPTGPGTSPSRSSARRSVPGARPAERAPAGAARRCPWRPGRRVRGPPRPPTCRCSYSPRRSPASRGRVRRLARFAVLEWLLGYGVPVRTRPTGSRWCRWRSPRWPGGGWSGPASTRAGPSGPSGAGRRGWRSPPRPGSAPRPRCSVPGAALAVPTGPLASPGTGRPHAGRRRPGLATLARSATAVRPGAGPPDPGGRCPTPPGPVSVPPCSLAAGAGIAGVALALDGGDAATMLACPRGVAGQAGITVLCLAFAPNWRSGARRTCSARASRSAWTRW